MKKRVIALLATFAVLFAAIAAVAVPTVAHAASAPFTVSDIDLYDLDGTTSTLSDRYGGTKRIVIAGRSTCGNTRRCVNTALSMSRSSAYDDVNFLVLDVDGNEEAFAEGFAAMETDRVRFYSSNDGRYNRWAFNNLYYYDGTSGSVTLPMIVVIDENDQVVFATTGPQSLTDICQNCFGIESGLLNLQLSDLDGTWTSMEERYDRTKRVIIVGRDTCTNTQNTSKSAIKLSEKDEYADINFLVLDYDGDREGFMSVYGPMETDRVRFYSDDADTYNSWAWDMYYASGQEGGITLPFVILIDENNHVVSVTTGAQNLSALCATYFGIANPNITTLDVRGYVSTEAGMELLELVNEARAAVGAEPLVWDADLAKTAIQRACEVGAYYSHTRPDGTSCFDVWPNWAMSAAENIAAYQTSVEEVNADWTNSEGHYANMINEDMVSFAAALYRNDNGNYYWVECFSGEVGPNGTGTAVAGDVTRSVTFDSEMVSLSTGYTGLGLTYGFTVQLKDLMLGSANLADPAAVYTTSDPSIATVSESGLVTATGVGKATVTATLKANPQLSTTVVVTVNARSIAYAQVYLDAYAYAYTGSPITPGVRVTLSGNTLAEGADYMVEYSNNTEIGTATVTVTGVGNYKGTATESFTIGEPSKTNISGATITVSGQTYTGAALTPAVTVKLGGETLKKDVDYTVAYGNNINVGTATVTVTGINDYEGTATKNFDISAASINGATVTAADQTFTGSALKPAVTVTLNGKTLASSDYTVSFGNNTNVGTATITVTGKGNYTGTARGTFKISAASLNDAVVVADDQVYTGSALKPEVTVVLGARVLTADTDYAVSYSSNTDVGTATVVVTGKGNYTGTASGTFKINEPSKIDLTDATVTAATQTYTGSALKPAVTVTLGGKTLSSSDYTVSYSNNTNAGTATITVTGKGNYTGTARGTFKISAASLSGATVTAAAQTYTGSALKPTPTVVLGGKTLSASDYGVSYSDNTAVGTATITVTGKGNYTGTAKGTFEIREAQAPVHAPGWAKENGSWYFYGNDGKPMTNHWERYDGAYYYFGADGKLVWNGWAYYGDDVYYMGSNGQVVRNTWVSADGKYYYIGSDYHPVKNGWATYGGKYYYLGADGTPQKTGWVLYGGKYYYLRNYNPVVNTWVQVGDTWYHFDKSGVCDNSAKA